MIRSILTLSLIALVHPFAKADTVTFEGLLSGAEQFYNGSDNAGGWSSGGVDFDNTFTDFGGGFTGWTGWSYSNVTDNTTPGFGNQYSAAPGGGGSNSETYAIGFSDGAFFNLPESAIIQSADLTNTTYARLSMLTGDTFAKQFGGVTGNDPDFFRVTFSGFSGLDATGSMTGAVTFDLADYTFADNSQDYVIGDWVTTDLTALGNARSVSLTFESSDVGAFGINTPTYVAMDNLTYVTAIPEPGTVSVLLAASLVGAWRLRRRKLSNLVAKGSCDSVA